MKRIICLIMVAVLFTSAYGCSKAGMGAGTGAALGGAVGALASRNKLVGGAIGAGAGFILGYFIGNELDKADLQKMGETLERNRTGVPLQWQNPNSGKQYSATPSSVRMTRDGTLIRDLKLETRDGEVLYVRAYRQPDGTWTLVQEDPFAANS